jgi:hypothetical protein
MFFVCSEGLLLKRRSIVGIDALLSSHQPSIPSSAAFIETVSAAVIEPIIIAFG